MLAHFIVAPPCRWSGMVENSLMRKVGSGCGELLQDGSVSYGEDFAGAVWRQLETNPVNKVRSAL